MGTPKIIQSIRDLESNDVIQDRDIDALQNTPNLVGKYYVPTVSRVSSSSAVLNTDPLPISWTGSGTYYSNGQYSIESSIAPSGSNPLTNAFNGNINDGFIALASINVEASLTITLPEAITVLAFKTYIPDKNGVDQLFIEGSNNKSSWTRVYAYDSWDTGLTTRQVTSPGAYKYYRFIYTLDSAATIEMREIQIGSYTIPIAHNRFTLSDIPNPLGINQRIMIKTPDFSNTGVSSSTLNDIAIDAVLLPNRYYELVYDGNRYLSKEIV